MADLKGFLTPVFEDRADCDRPDRMAPNDLRHCMSKCGDLIEKIAELGRFDLVEALIAELQSKVGKVLETTPMIMVGLRILSVAWRKGDFPMASSVLSALCTGVDAKAEPWANSVFIHLFSVPTRYRIMPSPISGKHPCVDEGQHLQ